MAEVKNTLENKAYVEVSRLTLRLKESERKIAALETELREANELLEAQSEKYKDCPHSIADCGCSYDKRSDVCAVHAPQLQKAYAKIAALDAVRKELMEAFDLVHVDAQFACGHISSTDGEKMKDALAHARELDQ